jgi:long-subunit fatty acid transport protein
MTSQIYFAKPLNDNWVLGFGINSPFGLSTEWGNDSPFRNAFGAVKTEITNSTFWAVAGYKIHYP